MTRKPKTSRRRRPRTRNHRDLHEGTAGARRARVRVRALHRGETQDGTRDGIEATATKPTTRTEQCTAATARSKTIDTILDTVGSATTTLRRGSTSSTIRAAGTATAGAVGTIRGEEQRPTTKT